jgi:hypothetical protein
MPSQSHIAKGKITWKYLIDQVIASVNLEIDAQLKETKRKPAPIKIDVATALKSVLKLADGKSGGPQLYSCIRAVFTHIESVLSKANDPALVIFLPEYSKLLCDELLSSSYFHLIGRKTFKGPSSSFLFPLYFFFLFPTFFFPLTLLLRSCYHLL